MLVSPRNCDTRREIDRAVNIFRVGLLFYTCLLKPLFIMRRPYRASDVRAERGDTWTLVMQWERHSDLRFGPGQWLAEAVGSPNGRLHKVVKEKVTGARSSPRVRRDVLLPSYRYKLGVAVVETRSRRHLLQARGRPRR